MLPPRRHPAANGYVYILLPSSCQPTYPVCLLPYSDDFCFCSPLRANGRTAFSFRYIHRVS